MHSWSAKHSHWVKNERGERMRQTEYFCGYKAHVSLNAEAGLITSIIVTPGDAPNGKQLPALVERDMRLGLPIKIVAGDQAYDDGGNHSEPAASRFAPEDAIQEPPYSLKQVFPHAHGKALTVFPLAL